MSMQDPLADMLTRIRNAQMAEKSSVSMPSAKLKATSSPLCLSNSSTSKASR